MHAQDAPAGPDAPWFIAFPQDHATTGAAWWARFLAPGYRHCLACRGVSEAASLVVEHRGSQMVVEQIALPIAQLLSNLQVKTGAMILQAPEDKPPPQAMLRPPMTCTEVCKSLLGITAWAVITPRQLAQHLFKSGARMVVPSSGSPQTWGV